MNTGEAIERFLTDSLGSVNGNQYLVGVSGGVDSMVLLHELTRLRDSHEFDIIAAHYNYRRHDNANEAEAVVHDWCDRNNVPCVEAHSLNSDDIETNRRGLEGELRRWRYDFFGSLMNDDGLDGLFLAHHRGDQVETVLLNIGRGTGLSGLGGMRAISERDGYSVFRPFLEVEKSTLQDTARTREIPFVDDPTNQSTDFTRNGLRHDVIKNWSELQPGLKTSVNRLSDLARQEDEFWQNYLEENVRYWEWPTEIQVDGKSFNQLARAARDRFLHSVPVKLLGTITGWSRTNIDSLRKLFKERSGCRIDLPGPLKGLVEYDRVCVARTDQSPEELRTFRPANKEFNRTIEGIGSLVVGSGNPPGEGFVSEGSLEPADQLLVRSWEEGDEMILDGASVSLKELFHRNRVPLRARHLWPVLVEGNSILGLPGLGISDDLKHNDNHHWIGFFPTHPGFHQLATG